MVRGHGRRALNRVWTRSLKKRLGIVLAVIGILIWVTSVAWPLMAPDGRDVSITYLRERSLGVIVGGALVAGGIILLAAAV